MTEDYRLEQSVSRGDAAAILRAMGDGVASGSVRLGAADGTVVEVPEWVDAEVEYETVDEAELEVELSWHPASEDEPAAADADGSAGTDTTDGTDVADAPSVGGSDTGEEQTAPAADETATPAADEAAGEEAAVGENPARLVGPAGGAVDGGDSADGTAEDSADGAVDRPASQARFELFEDRAGEWRWRLVHRNGNIIADSGEGYSRKSDARNGLRSVMRNAPGAEVVDAPD